MKLFISQPMNGLADAEILEKRAEVASYVYDQFKEDVEIIESFFQGAPHNAKPLWYLGESLKLMADADVVYFAAGWDKARGCKIEYECAGAYGIPIIVEHE